MRPFSVTLHVAVAGLTLLAVPVRAQAQEAEPLVTFYIESRQGCVSLKYPADVPATERITDVHRISSGGGFLGALNRVSAEIAGSGPAPSEDTLKAQGYKPDANGRLTRALTIRHRMTFQVCLKPLLRIDQNGEHQLILDANTATAPVRVVTEVGPGAEARKYVTRATANRVEVARSAFITKAESFMTGLGAELRSTRLPLSVPDVFKIVAAPTGLEVEVPFHFDGSSYSTVVGLRLKRADR
jgi:hypothetical protein